MTRFFCKSCGKEVDAHAENCSHCGKEFTAVRCPRCGFTGELELFSQGCPSCSYSEKEQREYYIEKPHKNRKRGWFLNSRLAYRLIFPALLLLIVLIYVFIKQL